MTHAYDGCTCVCHTSPPHSVMHCVPCCGPGAPKVEPRSPEDERQLQLYLDGLMYEDESKT